VKILVTGGAGFIGHNVVKLLEQQGHQCYVVDTFTNYGFVPKDELDYLKRERRRRINSSVHSVDITNRQSIDNMFMTFHPELVIHLASFPRQKVVNANPSLASEVMTTGLINLLEASRIHKVKRFVYISSSMVYGNFTDDVREDAVCNPQGQYGIMKLAGEWLTRDYTRQGYFDHVIIRPSAVYGEWDVEDRVVSKFMLTAMRGGVLRVNGAGESLDFTYVEDAAKGIAQAAISDAAKNKTYNITKSHSYTLLDAAELAVKISGQGTIEVRDKDADFPSRGALNIDAARRDFGYNPQVDVEEGFQRYYNWFKSSTYWQKKL
jgi:nucleoside-diphosphate-sugar epimerase